MPIQGSIGISSANGNGTLPHRKNGKALKKPHIRKWSEPHSNAEGHEWSYVQVPANKAKLSYLADLTSQAKNTQEFQNEQDYVKARENPGSKRTSERVHWVVSFGTREYSPDAFLDEFPQYRCEYKMGPKGKPKCVGDIPAHKMKQEGGWLRSLSGSGEYSANMPRNLDFMFTPQSVMPPPDKEVRQGLLESSDASPESAAKSSLSNPMRARKSLIDDSYKNLLG